MRTALSTRFIATLAPLALAGCGLFTVLPDKEPPGSRRFPETAPHAEPSLRARDLGIALSGGGSRSGFASIGALHALAERGVLGRVNAISSVSGGGYASLWYYTALSEASRTAGRADPAAPFAGAQFGNSVCRLVKESRLISRGQILRAMLSPYETMKQRYEDEIVTTFGHGRDAGPLRVTEVERLVARGGLPYPIVLTTSLLPSPQGWESALLELTPDLSGTPAWGYHRRDHHGDERFSRWVAISGAAAWLFLKQEVAVPTAPATQAVAADGGEAENLGVVALVRRGFRTIVALDFSHDPFYDYDDRRNLERRLPAWGYELKLNAEAPAARSIVPAWARETQGPDRPFVEGTVASTIAQRPGSEIGFVKLSWPPSLKSKIELRAGHRPPDAGSATQEFLQRCANNQPAQGEDLLRLFAQAMLQNEINTQDAFARTAGTEVPASHAVRFPHYPTIDQTFEAEQALTYLGFGYFLTEQFLLNGKLGQALSSGAGRP